MKIAQYEIAQNASSLYVRTETSKTQIKLRAIPPPKTPPPVAYVPVAQETEPIEEMEFHLSEKDEATLRLLERLIEALTGKKFKFTQVFHSKENKESSHALQNNSQINRPAFSLEIKQEYHIAETERMSFSSNGTVTTEDGRIIQFDLNLNMSRSYAKSQTTQIQIGSPLQDPLVINLEGAGLNFTGEKLRIDIDLDGTLDELPVLTSGNGYLTLDKNENGIIDDGSELFGPATGNGFEELTVYDEDGNGWIDENDAIFNSISIWSVDADGSEKLIGLKEAGVGAIFLSYTHSPYHFKESDETFAQLRSTGTYLKETGEAGTIHELDLKI